LDLEEAEEHAKAFCKHMKEMTSLDSLWAMLHCFKPEEMTKRLKALYNKETQHAGNESIKLPLATCLYLDYSVAPLHWKHIHSSIPAD
jgi:hypothetical protein